MKHIKVVTALIIGALMISSTGCGLINKTPEAIAKTPVAKVNGEVITKGDFQKRLDQIISSINSTYGTDYDKTADGKTLVTQQKKQLIQTMETEVLLLQEAKTLKLDADTKKIDTETTAQIADIKKNYYSDDQTKFEAAIKQAGYNDATLKVMMRKQVITNLVLDYMNKGITVTDAEVQTEYSNNPYNYTTSPNTIHFLDIVVKTEAEAVQVEARLKNKEDFATIAKELSLDTTTKASGGDNADIPYTDTNTDSTVLKAVIKLKDGEVSEPISTTNGYYVVKAISRKEYPAKPLDATLKASINSTLLQTKQSAAQQKQIDAWTKKAKIETFSNNL